MKSSFLRKVLETGTRIVMPEVCAGCGVAGSWICETCWKDVQEVEQNACCPRCGYPDVNAGTTCGRCSEWPPGKLTVRSAFIFAGPMRQSILRMKYHSEFARAAWHGEHLERVVVDAEWGDIDRIVAVPLHPRKLKKRGFNQSEKLAVKLGERLDVEVGHPLRRIRETVSQTTLGRDERQQNVEGAFVCDQSIRELTMLLVDDVATTCATLRACATACVDAGAARVLAVTIATEG